MTDVFASDAQRGTVDVAVVRGVGLQLSMMLDSESRDDRLQALALIGKTASAFGPQEHLMWDLVPPASVKQLCQMLATGPRWEAYVAGKLLCYLSKAFPESFGAGAALELLAMIKRTPASDEPPISDSGAASSGAGAAASAEAAGAPELAAAAAAAVPAETEEEEAAAFLALPNARRSLAATALVYITHKGPSRFDAPVAQGFSRIVEEGSWGSGHELASLLQCLDIQVGRRRAGFDRIDLKPTMWRLLRLACSGERPPRCQSESAWRRCVHSAAEILGRETTTRPTPEFHAMTCALLGWEGGLEPAMSLMLSTIDCDAVPDFIAAGGLDAVASAIAAPNASISDRDQLAAHLCDVAGDHPAAVVAAGAVPHLITLVSDALRSASDVSPSTCVIFDAEGASVLQAADVATQALDRVARADSGAVVEAGALPLLVELLQREPMNYVRATACRALHTVISNGRGGEVVAAGAAPALAACLGVKGSSTPRGLLARRALMCLAAAAPEPVAAAGVVPQLVAVLGSLDCGEADEEFPRQLGQLLRDKPCLLDAGVAELVGVLGHDDLQRRRAAVEAIWWLTRDEDDGNRRGAGGGPPGDAPPPPPPPQARVLCEAGVLAGLAKLMRDEQDWSSEEAPFLGAVRALEVVANLAHQEPELIAARAALVEVAHLANQQVVRGDFPPALADRCQQAAVAALAAVLEAPPGRDSQGPKSTRATGRAGGALFKCLLFLSVAEGAEASRMCSLATQAAIREMGDDFARGAAEAGLLAQMLELLEAKAATGGLTLGPTAVTDHVVAWCEMAQLAPAALVDCGALPVLKGLLRGLVRMDRGLLRERRAQVAVLRTGVLSADLCGLAGRFPEEFVNAEFVADLLATRQMGIELDLNAAEPMVADRWLHALAATHRQQLLELGVPAELLGEPKPAEHYYGRWRAERQGASEAAGPQEDGSGGEAAGAAGE